MVQSELATYTFEKTYHVGDLDGERETAIESHEGKGVSISPTPTEWRQIAPCVAGNTYRLRNPNGGDFLDYTNLEEDAHERIREYCLEAGYVVPATAYKVSYEDTHGERFSIHLETQEEAEKEAEEESRRNSTVSEVETVSLGDKGRSYWREAFETDPDDTNTLFVESLLEIWYAEDHGFDGVYWDYKLNVHKLSAPKGVIFQSKFGNWEAEIVE